MLVDTSVVYSKPYIADPDPTFCLTIGSGYPSISSLGTFERKIFFVTVKDTVGNKPRNRTVSI